MLVAATGHDFQGGRGRFDVAQKLDEPFHNARVLAGRQGLNQRGMAGVAAIAQNGEKGRVVDRREEQERVEDFRALVFGITVDGLFEGDEGVAAYERGIANAVAEAAGPLCQFLVQEIGKAGDRGQYFGEVWMLVVLGGVEQHGKLFEVAGGEDHRAGVRAQVRVGVEHGLSEDWRQHGAASRCAPSRATIGRLHRARENGG